MATGVDEVHQGLVGGLGDAAVGIVIRILLNAGQTQAAVAAKLRVSRWTLSRALDTALR